MPKRKEGQAESWKFLTDTERGILGEIEREIVCKKAREDALVLPRIGYL